MKCCRVSPLFSELFVYEAIWILFGAIVVDASKMIREQVKLEMVKHMFIQDFKLFFSPRQ